MAPRAPLRIPPMLAYAVLVVVAALACSPSSTDPPMLVGSPVDAGPCQPEDAGTERPPDAAVDDVAANG